MQSTLVFKIGSCVMGLSVHADEAGPKRGNRRFPRPSEEEVLQTYRQFHAAFARYIADRGWTNLETSRKKPDFDRKTPSPGVVNNDTEQPPSEAEAESPVSDLTPAEIATAAGLAGGTALLGSLLMLGATGVRREEAIAAIRDLLRGRVPEDPFEAWKRKYEALGWKYREKNGVATFDPVDGARNEGGEIYSAERGGFVRPVSETPPAPPPLPRDGDVNDRGEVWSSFSGGYVERKTYDQDMANRATLAEKDRSDLADMQRPDADVAELNRKIAETRRKGAEMRTYFKARDELLGALGEQRGREGVDALLDESRSGLFDELSDRLLTTPADNDYRKGLKDLLPLADVIGNQMRPGYTPTYTYRDAAQDTLLQSGAAALDAILTKGWASSTVGSSLAMRDAARAGGGVVEIATAGVKAAVTDVLFGKAIHYGAGYAGEAWRAGKKAVAGIAESGADLLAQASRRSKVATDLVEKMRKNLGTLDQGVHVDGSGRLRASLTDVLEVQKNPHQVQALKQSGSASTQEAFNNTLRNEVYKPHDQMLLEKLRQSSPELADKKLVVHDFRTPGKTANPINTDRDFRVLTQNADGKWVEVPKTKWEQHSNDAFAELTFFDKTKCPDGMSPAQQKAWWAEQHGHTPTDRAFREAGRDYSDQIADLRTGQRGNLPGGEVGGTGTTRIAELKDIASGKVPVPSQPVKLADPQGLAQQFHEKVTGNLRRGDPFEAIAQAQKGVDTLDSVRKAYGAQNIPAGEVPGNLRQAMDIVKSSNLPVHPDAAVLHTLEGKLERLGFSDLGDFSQKLSSQFEGLKWTP
ncbi:MAG: hypothetical protein Q7T45_15020 [Bradyrhizobium sp.]|uniref:hypothetical protein n=1 Tax=Bradyrhizobium sp. TaxID=376 RepID=UPI0027259E50|nr:hypothetical protein [Bradyrhizobium sp.]MDO8399123.1 hypothetical protein [Bradyrhizobium sp.]